VGATELADTRTVKDSEDEYVRKTKRTAYLLRRHRRIIAQGFRPSAVAVNDPDEDDPLIHEPCYVCRYPDLLGVIEWTNPKTGKKIHTGFVCFSRIVEKLEGISERDRRILRWVSQNREWFYGHKYTIEEAEHIRLTKYVYPLTKVYGHNWTRAVAEAYAQRSKLNLTWLESGVLDTLYTRSGPYWTGHLTAEQQAILNGIVRKFLDAGFDPS
jgi:hypothetical protein